MSRPPLESVPELPYVPQSPLVEVQREVPIAPPQLWAVLSQYFDVAKWHPKVDRAERLPGPDSGLGAHRRNHLSDGMVLEERVVRWNDGQLLTFDVRGGPRPIRTAYVTMKVDPTERGALVTFQGDFRMRWGLLGRVLHRVLFTPMMRSVFTAAIEGLAHYAQTGEIVGRKVPRRRAG